MLTWTPPHTLQEGMSENKALGCALAKEMNKRAVDVHVGHLVRGGAAALLPTRCAG
jgi:hypothetical protein